MYSLVFRELAHNLSDYAFYTIFRNSKTGNLIFLTCDYQKAAINFYKINISFWYPNLSWFPLIILRFFSQ